MSTLSPNRGQDHLMSSSPVSMATKTKPASKAATAAANATAKQKSQMHRRSRTGLSVFFGYLLGSHVFPVSFRLSYHRRTSQLTYQPRLLHVQTEEKEVR